MYKLTFKKRAWIVKQFQKGQSAIEIAKSQKINKSCIYQIISKFKESGWDNLKDHKTGRPETLLNENAQIIVLDIRKRYNYGALNIEQILKKRGFGISHRQIEKVLIRNNCVIPNIKKQKPRKWVRYELPNPNDLWHTDWSYDPFSGQQLSIFIDDRTRLITSFGIFKNANTENTLALLNSGIAEYGKPKAIMTDHGAQYYANHPNADQNNSEFRKHLNLLGIKHYLARVNRPQTNGKAERFFRTYKEEFTTGTFANLREFISHYNEKRLHMSLNYKTPKEVWEELIKKV